MLRYKYIYQISLIIFLAISNKTYSQQETVWFDGAARSFFTRDFLDEDVNLDETTPRNISNGYNLLGTSRIGTLIWVFAIVIAAFSDGFMLPPVCKYM